jgi:hypothetical protein
MNRWDNTPQLLKANGSLLGVMRYTKQVYQFQTG